MKARLFVLVAAFSLIIGICLTGTRVHSRDPLPEPRFIDELDRVMQQRFVVAPNFGISRIGPSTRAHFDRGFSPKTREEKHAVANLKDANWKVGLYLIGRRAYETPRSLPEGPGTPGTPVVLGRLNGSSDKVTGDKQLNVFYRLNYRFPSLRM